MWSSGGDRGAFGQVGGAANGGKEGGQEQATEQACQTLLASIEEKMRTEEKREDTPTRYSSVPGGSGDTPYFIHPWKDPAFGAPIEYRAIHPLPPTILRSYSMLQSMSFQGLLPEIHRAWVTVDNVLYIWDYHTEASYAVIDELDQLLVAVGLVRPNTDVFKESVKYLLVVCTPTAVELFALCFADGTPDSPLQARRTTFRVSTDGVTINKVVGSSNGRIFLAGLDGNIYEIQYHNGGDRYFYSSNRCRKLNRSSSIVSVALTALVNTLSENRYIGGAGRLLGGGDPADLVDLAIDHSRNILYSLSSTNYLQVYDLGEDDKGCKYITGGNIIDMARIYFKHKHRGESSRFQEAGHPFRILSLHVIPATESATRHVMAVSNAGYRFYFETFDKRAAIGSKSVSPRPTKLLLVDVRLPPKPTVWDALRNRSKGQTDTRREKFDPGYVPNHSPLSYHRALHSDGCLLLADGSEDEAADSIVAFAVEGSKDRGGEIVCEVRAHDAAAMGRVRAMACEPFVVFPIEERERALDQLRYLTAVSASASVSSSSSSSNSSSNNIRRLGKETTYQEMYEKSNGPSPLHLGSCYCSPLSETSQPLASSRLFLILTSTGLHVVGKIRPVDVVFRVLKKESSRGTRASVNGFTAQSCLNFLEELYGADEVCSWLYQVAAQVPSDLGFPVGRQLLASPAVPTHTAGMTQRALAFIKSTHARPPLPPANSMLFPGFSSLLLLFTRLVRPVWHKPVAYNATNMMIGPIPTLFLQPPEIQAIIAPLHRLKDAVATLYPNAIRNPARDNSPLLASPAGYPALPPSTTASSSLPYDYTYIPPHPSQAAAAAASAATAAATARDAAELENAQVHALYRLMGRTLQVLELLDELALYWLGTNRMPLELSSLQDLRISALITSSRAHDDVKATIRALLQPDNATSMSDALTTGLSQRAPSFFSRGDQLTYEGRRLLALAEAAPLDSSDRAHAGAKAAEAFVRAAAYWRTPVDIDSLDGGQNRRGRGGLSHALLRLAPTSLPIISAVVDMALVAANNFGASIYRPPVRKGKKAVVPSPLDDDDLVRSLVPQQRNELKQRCFTTVRNALMWLLDPQQREPASVDNSISGWALVQEELERAAWTLLTRALKSEDADLHSLLYTALLQDNGRESQREMLFSLSSPHLEAFLYARSQQERGKEGGREGGTEGGGLNLYKEYLFHNQRYAEAMELLESAAVAQSEDLKLNDRVRLLTEAIQCASLAQNVARTGRPGKHPRVSGPKVQALQDQLDVATLQLQVLNRLKEAIRLAHSGGRRESGREGDMVVGTGEEEEEERHVFMLERGFVSSSQVFTVANTYTLWEECLALIDMCHTDDGRGMQQRVQSLWRAIIFNELPANARSPQLQAWLEHQSRDILSRWWSSGRARRGLGVGRMEGELDQEDDKPMQAVYEKIKSIARSMRLNEVAGGTLATLRPAFPLHFLTDLLLELEAEVDTAQGRRPSLPPFPRPSFPHRTWRALRQVGIGFIDIFLEHMSVYRDSRMKTQQQQHQQQQQQLQHRSQASSQQSPSRLKVHVLDALRDLTARWYEALREGPMQGGMDGGGGTGGGVMIDTRQQSMVVRELSRLANTTHAAETEAKLIIDELSKLRERFQYFPEQVD